MGLVQKMLSYNNSRSVEQLIILITG